MLELPSTESIHPEPSTVDFTLPDPILDRPRSS